MITMKTEGQVYVVNHGQTLEIKCEFHTEDFDMFENPVVWKKYQKNEETQINIMGNIFEPFLATNRFEVTFVSNNHVYCLVLKLSSKGTNCNLRSVYGLIIKYFIIHV